MTRRTLWQPLIAAALLVLLVALATLQYRWLGEVSQAERERMRASLRTRASDFADAFDRELTRAYVAFHLDGKALNADAARAMADAFSRWQSTSTAPAIVDAVYLLDGGGEQALSLKRLDPSRATLDPVEWPASMEKWRARARQHTPGLRGAALLMPDAIDSSIPALIVSVPFVTRLDTGNHFEVFTKPGSLIRAIVVVLNPDRLRALILDPLVAKYFGTGDGSEYVIAIVRRDDPSHVVYASDPRAATLDDRTADVTAPLFDLRMDELARLNPVPSETRRDGANARMAITIVRRATSPDGARVMMGGGADQGAWQARVGYRSGSLETIVARSRHRNLAIGLGVLGLLAASFVLIIASAQRQQRLARQQIEFVAAVSHELRTPLAVIRSAGENLADGVVAGDEQVKRYGSLIEREGRRLTDMVERVLEFAGIVSGHASRARTDVDLSRAIADAVGSLRAEARDRDVDVIVEIDGSLPPVAGEPDALRSALQNVVSNAVKYSLSGGQVVVRAAADGPLVRVTIVDCGIGIDADDLPHVFKPFFRGRRASDAQIRGAGIGLSVVRHVVDAHRGAVRVDSRPREGTTVTIDLPVAPPAEADSAAVATGNAAV